jgi:uncharacterized protein (DUF427 family)
MQAQINGTVIAESDETIVVEGNHYFPPSSLALEHFTETDHVTSCFWKGKASYYTINVDGNSHENAAWYYPKPKKKAKKIQDYVAFYSAVTVSS